MEKFADRQTNVTPECFHRGSIIKLILLWVPSFVGMIGILLLSGCATVQAPEYISRVDHPYDRKMYASFEKVSSAVYYVLKTKGWAISEESLPSIYERDDRYDNNGYRNLLIMTSPRKHGRLVYATYEHVNAFIHCMAGTCDVEIRYEAQTPSPVKEFITTRNDPLVNGIFDAVQQEVSR